MIDYKLIIDKDDFTSKKINESKQKLFDSLSSSIISDIDNDIRIKNKDVYYSYRNDRIYGKCQDIINKDKNLFENNFEKIIFISNTLFNDNEKFVRLVKAAGINNYDLDILMIELIVNKKLSETYGKVRSKFEKNINKLVEYTGVNNRELILNKIQQLYYYDIELFNQKQKQV